MAISECALNLNSNSREMQSHGTLEFPLAAYSSCHDDKREEEVIPWHYHEEIEIILIKSGEMEVKTPSRSCLLKEGDIAIINSNELHYAKAHPKCILNSLVFSARLIYGYSDSIFEKKYVRPILSCASFSLFKIEENKELASLFSNAFSSIEKESEGYEFIARESISKLWLYVYKSFENEIDKKDPLDVDEIRVRAMMDYIHQKYSGNITLKDIASIANISEREALRSFQKTIEYSPIQYLIKYRMQKGALMLMNNKDLSISEISSSCGFESPSNFAKLFRRYYKTSPSAYRKNNN